MTDDDLLGSLLVQAVAAVDALVAERKAVIQRLTALADEWEARDADNEWNAARFWARVPDELRAVIEEFS